MMSNRASNEDATEPIRGKVAELINDRTLVLNIGRDAGVEKGMEFKILESTPLEIHDPETSELLDSLTVTKAVVKVIEVSARIAIAQTFRTSRVNVGGEGSALGLSSLFIPPKYEDRVETLRYDEEDGAPLDELVSRVQKGDAAVALGKGESARQIVTLQR